ncbi:unnamed protein product [Ostreobium quekettii]|uniref:2Fe-2S ferredoxin-type domain-containing protein n=1 Tax=Ostreobium quekettii TaxID=121088 RepID=A0A8S1ITY2_9CHLO|nr:unnamed protein product [Ostreobium quekettii]|eukprot:evm.model.scf_1543.3 EVM.evm.TU.scf_1543.3   scf_1543:7394-8045(+)
MALQPIAAPRRLAGTWAIHAPPPPAMQCRSGLGTSSGRSLGVAGKGIRTCGMPSATHPRQQGKRCVDVRAYKVTFVAEDGTKVQAEAADSEFLLEVGERNNVEIPSSCRSGMCGTCISKLKSGEVDMSEAMDLEGQLSPEQLAEGYILACSSKPKSDCTVEWKPY